LPFGESQSKIYLTFERLRVVRLCVCYKDLAGDEEEDSGEELI